MLSHHGKTDRGGVAEAFVGLWDKEGQFGQFVDDITGEIAVGGSTSGAIVPAAMVLASQYFGNKRYLEVAEASAQKMYDHYVSKGITCGGPGGCHYRTLTANRRMPCSNHLRYYTKRPVIDSGLTYAEEMATQFFNLGHGIRLPFSPSVAVRETRYAYHRRCIANTQNKHGSPGICTHSGVALLRLYRATGNFAVS